MKVGNVIIEGYSKWLALIGSLVVGMLFACHACGQETEFPLVIDSFPSVIIPSVESESVLQFSPPSESVPFGEFEMEPSLIQNADQSICTKGTCGDRAGVVCVSGRDEIWLVSARESHLCPNDLSRLKTFRLTGGDWQPSSLAELTNAHAVDKSKSTFLYSHGNRTDLSWAKSRGLQVYETVFGSAQAVCERPPIRMVIFAWKSEQEKLRLYPDYNIKSKRAPLVGKALANMLVQFQDRDMVLCGFSLGAQVILGAASDSRCLAQNDLPGKYQIALLAPALDPGYVCSGIQELPFNPFVARTVLFVSQNDRAIKVAEKIAHKSCREWLPVFIQLAAQSDFALNPIKVNDVTGAVSKRHSTNNYAGASQVKSLLNEMLVQVNSASANNASIGHAIISQPVLIEAPAAITIDAPVMVGTPKSVLSN